MVRVSRAILLLVLVLPPLLLAGGPTHAQGNPRAFVSDDFSAGELNTRIWRFVNPLGDSSISHAGTGTDDVWLNITVPGGIEHDAWTMGNRAVRIMQRAEDVDFGLEVKFTSNLNRRFQLQGILVEQDEANFLRFDFYSDGFSTRLFATSFLNGIATIPALVDMPVAENNEAPLYMRVLRQGDLWTLTYSVDGLEWLPGVEFVQAMRVTAVGVAAANSANVVSGPPGHTLSVDYFFNMAEPIDPEDVPSTNSALPVNPDDATPAQIVRVHPVVGQQAAWVSWTTDEPTMGTLEYGATTAYELGAVVVDNLSLHHAVRVEGLQPDATYNFQVVAEDINGNISFSDNLQVTTSARPVGPVIDVWYGERQVFGHAGLPQQYANIVGNVLSADADIAALTYTLNGGEPRRVSVGPDFSRLSKPGDFNLDIPYADLSVGENEVVITARDWDGNETSQTVTVVYDANLWVRSDLVSAEGACEAVPAVDPHQSQPGEPVVIDWQAVESISDVAQVVDGLWQITDEGVRPVIAGYDRLIAIGDMSWTDYEVLVPVTINAVDPAGFEVTTTPAMGFILRWQGHFQEANEQPFRRWWPMGALAWYRWSVYTLEGDPLPPVDAHFTLVGSGDRIVRMDRSNLQLEVGVPYLFRLRVETLPDQGSLYSFKVWEAGQPEPTRWLLTGEPDAGLQSGSLLLVANSMDVTFGDVTVTFLDGEAEEQAQQAEGPAQETTAASSCAATADTALRLRSGPGTQYTLQGSLAPGQPIRVTGQFTDPEGFVWWRLGGAVGAGAEAEARPQPTS